MSGASLRGRIEVLDDLRQIVTAMHNLAYAELQRFGRIEPIVLEAGRAVAQALSDTLGREPAAGDVVERAGQPLTLLAIGSERGFCGGFNDAIAEAIAARRRQPATRWPPRWWVAGDRLRLRTEAMLPDAIYLPSCTSAEECRSTVQDWLAVILSAGPLPGRVLEILRHDERGPRWTRVLPHPELPAPGSHPLRQMPRSRVLKELAIQAARVGLLDALVGSLVQESRWRLAQMQRARDHLDDAGSRLRRTYFRQRQADITGELQTLMSSLDLLAGD